MTVRQPPDAGYRDFIISLRHQIEAFIVGNGLEQIADEQFGPIESALAELKAACDSGDVAAVARCDMAFHQSTLEACGGEDFLPIWKWLCSQMLLAYSQLEDFDQVHREHVAIMEAVRKRSKKETFAAIQANIR